ncbi:PilZ domain-containing protein [bacterium]|nr:MAG: PilZ domain-containing protein [bacterium]
MHQYTKISPGIIHPRACPWNSDMVLEPTSEFLEFVKSFEKRTHKRISLGLDIEIITNEMNCAAFTKNISENGLNITLNPLNTSLDLKTEKKFEVKFQIPPGEECLNLFCEKKWLSEVPPQGLMKEVGIEIIDPPHRYIEFLNTLK